jgi:hypothetical protein
MPLFLTKYLNITKNGWSKVKAALDWHDQVWYGVAIRTRGGMSSLMVIILM